MKFYEVKFIAEPGSDAGTLDSQAKDAATFVSGMVEVHHATVHARPSPDSQNHHDVAVFVSVDSESDLHVFSGIMARKYGLPMTNYVPLGEAQDTLDFKAMDESEEAALREALGADDEFTITDIRDRADE